MPPITRLFCDRITDQRLVKAQPVINNKCVCFFFNLPSDLYNYICSEWITNLEIGFLDCAVTERSLRTRLWFDQMKSKSMFQDLKRTMNEFKTNLLRRVSFMNWCNLRNIHMTNLKLIKKDIRKNGDLRFEVNLDTVEDLEIEAYPNVTKFINSLNKLKSVNLAILDTAIIGTLDPLILDNLTSLKIHDRTEKVVGLPLFATHCYNLTFLHLMVDVDPDILCEIIRNSPNLTDVGVISNSQVLESIFVNSKKVTGLLFTMWFIDESIPFNILNNYSSTWLTMKHFGFGYIGLDTKFKFYHFNKIKPNSKEAIVEVFSCSP